MSKVALGAHLLSGLMFVFIGLDGLPHFLPMPELVGLSLWEATDPVSLP